MSLSICSIALEKIDELYSTVSEEKKKGELFQELNQLIFSMEGQGIEIARFTDVDTSRKSLDTIKKVFSKHIFVQSLSRFSEHEVATLYKLAAPFYDNIKSGLHRDVFFYFIKKIPQSDRETLIKKLLQLFSAEVEDTVKFLFLTEETSVEKIGEIFNLVSSYNKVTGNSFAQMLDPFLHAPSLSYKELFEKISCSTSSFCSQDAIDILTNLSRYFPDSCLRLLLLLTGKVVKDVGTLAEIKMIFEKMLELFKMDLTDVLLVTSELIDPSYTCQERIDIIDSLISLGETEVQQIWSFGLQIIVKAKYASQRLSIISAIHNIQEQDRKLVCSLIWELFKGVPDVWGIEKIFGFLSKEQRGNRRKFFYEAKPFLLKILMGDQLNCILRPEKIHHFFVIFSLLPYTHRVQLYGLVESSSSGLSLQDKKSLAGILSVLSFPECELMLKILGQSFTVRGKQKKLEIFQFVFFVPQNLVLDYLILLQRVDDLQQMLKWDCMSFIDYVLFRNPKSIDELHNYLFNQLKNTSEPLLAKYLSENILNYKHLFRLQADHPICLMAEKVVDFSVSPHLITSPYRIFESLHLKAKQKINSAIFTSQGEFVDHIYVLANKNLFFLSHALHIESMEIKNIMLEQPYALEALLRLYDHIDKKLLMPANKEALQALGIPLDVISERVLLPFWNEPIGIFISLEKGCLHRIVTYMDSLIHQGATSDVLTELEHDFLRLNFLWSKGYPYMKNEILDVYYTLPSSCALSLAEDSSKDPAWHGAKAVIVAAWAEYLESRIFSDLSFIMELSSDPVEKISSDLTLYSDYIKNLILPHLRKDFTFQFNFNFFQLGNRLLNCSGERALSVIIDHLSMEDVIEIVQIKIDQLPSKTKENIFSFFNTTICEGQDRLHFWQYDDNSNTKTLTEYGIIKLLSYFDVLSFIPSQLSKISRLNLLINIRSQGVYLSTARILEENDTKTISKYYQSMLNEIYPSIEMSDSAARSVFLSQEGPVQNNLRVFAVCKLIAELYLECIDDISNEKFINHFGSMHPFFKKIVFFSAALLLNNSPYENIQLGENVFLARIIDMSKEEIKKLRRDVFFEVIKLSHQHISLLI